MYTKFSQNRLGFVEDTTKTFWCVFSVHSVYMKKRNSIIELRYVCFSATRKLLKAVSYSDAYCRGHLCWCHCFSHGSVMPINDRPTVV